MSTPTPAQTPQHGTPPANLPKRPTRPVRVDIHKTNISREAFQRAREMILDYSGWFIRNGNFSRNVQEQIKVEQIELLYSTYLRRAYPVRTIIVNGIVYGDDTVLEAISDLIETAKRYRVEGGTWSTETVNAFKAGIEPGAFNSPTLLGIERNGGVIVNLGDIRDIWNSAIFGRERKDLNYMSYWTRFGGSFQTPGRTLMLLELAFDGGVIEMLDALYAGVPVDDIVIKEL